MKNNTKEIVVLTKSKKKGGYCVAGIDTTSGKWIRPISNNAVDEGAVPISDILYNDGSKMNIFDKVQIEFISESPTLAQPENWVYNPETKWKRKGTSSLYEVINFRGYDKPDMVFCNYEKEVNESNLDGKGSLLLLSVINSSIFIKTFNDGHRRLQLNFTYNNANYRYFKISDEVINNRFLNYPDGVYDSRDKLSAVFSLTGKYDITNKYYKMVAQMF